MSSFTDRSSFCRFPEHPFGHRLNGPPHGHSTACSSAGAPMPSSSASARAASPHLIAAASFDGPSDMEESCSGCTRAAAMVAVGGPSCSAGANVCRSGYRNGSLHAQTRMRNHDTDLVCTRHGTRPQRRWSAPATSSVYGPFPRVFIRVSTEKKLSNF